MNTLCLYVFKTLSFLLSVYVRIFHSLPLHCFDKIFLFHECGFWMWCRHRFDCTKRELNMNLSLLRDAYGYWLKVRCVWIRNNACRWNWKWGIYTFDLIAKVKDKEREHVESNKLAFYQHTHTHKCFIFNATLNRLSYTMCNTQYYLYLFMKPWNCL